MKYAHIDFAPTAAAREAARRALSAEETTPSPPSVARATVAAVAAGRRLTPPVMRRLATGAEADPVAAWARKVAAAMDAADKAASSGAAPHTSVAVVLPLPRDVAEYVSLDGEGADLHATLCYLGSTADLSPEAVAMVRACVERWAAEMPCFPARLSGVGRFAGPDADAVVLLVDAPGLSVARDDLCRRVRALGVAVPAEHGFTPHATLCYVAKGAETPPVPYDLPLALTLDAASLWVGDDRAQAVPLTGLADPTMMRDGATVRGEGITLLFDTAAPPAVGHRTWNQIARYGTWKGHPQGPFTFDAASFRDIVRNFRATKNPPPVDFEHQSEVLPDNVAQEGVPALAWVVDLDDRGESGLWGLFEWVDALAVDYVRTKKYRYLSPAVQFAATSRETGARIGARLTSVALTNHPFLDGMEPLTADGRAHGGRLPDDVRSAVLEVFERLPLPTEPPRMTTHRLGYHYLGDTIATRDDLLQALRIMLALPKLSTDAEVLAEFDALDKIVSAKDGGANAAATKVVDTLREALALEALTPAAGVVAAVRKGLTELPTTPTTARAATQPGLAPVTSKDTHMADPKDKAPSDGGPKTEPTTASAVDPAHAKMAADLAAMTERFNTVCASIRKMAGVDSEEDENAALAKLQKIVDEMNAIQVEEAGRMADRAIAVHGLSASKRDTLIAHYRRDPGDFAEMFPKAAQTVTASETAAKPSGAPLAPEVKTLLTTQVTTPKPPPAPAVTLSGSIAEVSRLREERAAVLLREGKARTHSEASMMADAEMHAQRRAEAVAPFAG